MFIPHFVPFGNKKIGKHEEKINEIYKIRRKIQEFLNNEIFVWPTKPGLVELECQTTEIHLENFLKKLSRIC